MLMLLLENTNNICYSLPSYQKGFDDYNNNTVSKNNNNNANANLANNNKNNVKHTSSHQKKHFVICESCFWCTTYLINNIIIVSKCCPVCNNAKVEVLTVANDLLD
jgi:hypothetical protein